MAQYEQEREQQLAHTAALEAKLRDLEAVNTQLQADVTNSTKAHSEDKQKLTEDMLKLKVEKKAQSEELAR